MVARGGEIVLRKGYGLADREAGTPYSADTVFTIGSITKSFTAAAILEVRASAERGGSPTFTFLFDAEGRLHGVRIEAGN